jgi:type I restriction enzyme S subunit
MLNQKSYSCGICKTTPDQISHHKSHIETQKHKDKRELFKFKLEKINNNQLEKTYKTTIIDNIITETETIIYTPNYKTNLLTINKKLNEPISDIIDNITTHINTLKVNMIEESNSITNKDALKNKIHEIHNFLRNNGAGYGMNALKVFKLFYGLKKLEECELLDMVNLKKPDCEFSYLLSLANNEEGERLSELILINVLQSIYNSNVSKILFYDIPQNISSSVFIFLIKEINKITNIEKDGKVLLSGKIYEYFIGRDESAISELGAYFTDRHITRYSLQKVRPKRNEDGTLPTMIDMFGGSGGFTTEFINYYNENFPQLINWSIEINKIYHYDMNEDVINSAALEFFCLTRILPNMSNLRYANSFTDEFVGHTNELLKYKYVFTNPPYGGDKNVKTEAQIKREIVKEYITSELITITDEDVRIRRQNQLRDIGNLEKQEKKDSDKTKVSVSTCSGRIQKFAKDNALTGNDKESCSLMLIMDILEVGGTALGVLKEGVIFDTKYKDLRKCLVKNYNVREIISIPQDQFENTSTKTSIVIFDNTEEKTSEVVFSDLVVERYKENKFAEVNGNIIIIECKDDIIGVSDMPVSVASKEEILNNKKCSLDGKDYNKKVISVGEEYKLVKLESICEFLPKSKRNASFGQTTGQYNFYTSSDKVQKCDVADYNEECLIIGDGGVANIKISEMFSCSDHNHIIRTIYNKYIFYLINGYMKFLEDGFSGSVLKNLSKNYLKNLQIPIPKSQSKMQEWVDRISVPYNERNTKQTQIKEFELFVQNRIKEIGENEECDEVELGSVCNIWCGKNLPKEKAIKGIYNVYGGGNSSYTHNKYNLEGFNIIISRVGNNSVTLVNEKFYLTDNGFSLIVNDDKINKYLSYYLLNNKEKIFNAGNGSAQKVISKGKLSDIKIKIPKNKQLIQDLEVKFQQIETLQNEVKNADVLYKQLIQELSQEAIPQQTIIIEEQIQILPSQINEIVEENKVIIPNKKIVKKTKRKMKIIENE